MKRKTIYLLSIILFVISFAILSCESKKETPTMAFYDSYNIAHVKVGTLYYFPLMLNDGTGNMPFEIFKSPEKSSRITFAEKEYLRWKPAQEGTYEIIIRNAANSFQQSYEIKVTK